PTSAAATTAPSAAATRSAAANPGAPAAGRPCTKAGSTLVIGQVGTFSGIIGGSIGSAVAGLKVWAEATNASGGIACHPVQVVSVDDGGENGRAQSAIQQLVENDHAVAVNAFVPITMAGVQPYVDSHHVPIVGGDLLSPTWYSDQYFFPQGGPLDSILYGISKYAALNGGHKYSFFYCVEASPCTSGEDSLTHKGIAAKAGLESVGDQPISLAGSNFTQQCQTAKGKGADVVFIGAGVSAVTAISRDCANQNYHPIYLALSLGVTNSQESDPNLDGLAIGNAQFAWMTTGTPALTEYHDALARYAPSLDNSGGAAAGWTSGKLFQAAILKLGSAAYGDLTSADVLKGLALIHGETLGGLVPGQLTFHAGAPATLDPCVFIAAIKNAKWSTANGGRAICGP
ncbi:MAG TPA: ABC transporter substrate-binding protein, partial [Mycobacteriales bacterium]|nr:ABC transporter substrate-binding protein [Mycobacteriales bacterium]